MRFPNFPKKRPVFPTFVCVCESDGLAMDASARALSPDTPRELLLAFVLGQDTAPRAPKPRRRRAGPAGHAPGPPGVPAAAAATAKAAVVRPLVPVQASLSARRRDRTALCTIAPSIREICAQRGGTAPLGDSAVDALERGARRWLAALRARLAQWKARAAAAAAGRLSCEDVGACLLPVQTLRLERYHQFCVERRRLLSVCSFAPGLGSDDEQEGQDENEEDENEEEEEEEENEGECLAAAAAGAGGVGPAHGFGAAAWAAARARATGECGLPAGAVARPVLEMRLELDRAELADRAAGTAARRAMLTRPGARRCAAFRAWAALAQWPWAVPRDVCDGIALVLTDWLDRVARSARLARQRAASDPAGLLTGADIDACLRAAGTQWFSPPPPWA